MTTFADLIAETRLHLMSGHSDRLNQLLSGIDNAVTSIPLKFAASGVHEGTTLAVDLEEMYVIQEPASNTATVIRAYNGSTAVSHLADAIVRVSPKFSDYRIGKYVNDSLENLSADGLFRIKSLEFTYTPSVSSYNLNASDLIDIWRVKFDIPGPSQVWPDLDKWMWELDQDANTTDFPNGKSLLLKVGGAAGHNVRVSYKAGFAPLVAVGDDVLAVSGLHNEAHKVVPLGAAIYCLGGREVKRTFLERQPEPRRSDEVPVGSAIQAMKPILQEYSDIIRRERRRLRRKYPDQW